MSVEQRRILTVLRSGREFQPRHVQAMQRQLERHASDASFVCLSDVDVPGVETIPLKYDWPDWWSKMEAFRPDIKGGFLLTDLDNVFLGALNDILSVTEYTTQRGESNALAYYPEDVRAIVWGEWIRDPERHMREFDQRYAKVKHQFGDGGFIKSIIMHADHHWEDLLPNQVLNLSALGADAAGRRSPLLRWPFTVRDLPKEARVLLCWRPHRPWLLPMFRSLYQENV